MNIRIQYILDRDLMIKRFLREHSNYYKNIIRNPQFINEIGEMMKKEYHLTFPDKIDKFKNNLSLINTFVDLLK